MRFHLWVRSIVKPTGMIPVIAATVALSRQSWRLVPKVISDVHGTTTETTRYLDAYEARRSGPQHIVSKSPRREGTASIRGIVTTQHKVPIDGASVHLRSFGSSEDAVTDERGRFVFTGLPQGRYDVSASNEGYVRMRYGQRQPFEPITVVEIGGGEVVDDLAIELPLAAVITGRLVDQNDMPVQGAAVGVVRASREQRRFGFSRSDLTQDRFPLPALGEHDAVLTDSQGRFLVGGLSAVPYYVLASPPSNWAARAADEAPVYVPTYYPGSPHREDAQAITASISGHTDLNFAVKSVKRTVITGWVSSADGARAAEGTVVPFLQTRDGRIRSDASGSTSIRPDGSFSAQVMPNGDYLLAASTGRPWSAVGVQKMVNTGSTSLHVGTAKVSGVEIRTEPCGVVSGRIALPDELANQGRRLRIYSIAVSDEDEARRVAGSAPIDADGKFVLRNVRGRIFLAVSGLNDIAWVKQLRTTRHDVTDVGLNVAPGSRLDGVVVELATWSPQVVGAVTTPDGSRASDSEVLFFSATKAKWSDPLARFTKITRTSDDGNYSVGGLLSGDYLAIAVDHLDIDADVDMSTLMRLRNSATTVRIRGGNHVRLDLREKSGPTDLSSRQRDRRSDG